MTEQFPKFEELPKEQQAEIKKVSNRLMKGSMFSAVNTFLLMTVFGILTILVNALYIHSLVFVFVASFAANISLIKSMNNSLDEKVLKARLEIKKILENK